jgi:hypothetical protein
MLLLHARELQAGKTVDSSNIDFDVITKEEKKQFSSDLNTDLSVLKLSRKGHLDVRQERLRHALGSLGNLKKSSCRLMLVSTPVPGLEKNDI